MQSISSFIMGNIFSLFLFFYIYYCFFKKLYFRRKPYIFIGILVIMSFCLFYFEMFALSTAVTSILGTQTVLMISITMAIGNFICASLQVVLLVLMASSVEDEPVKRIFMNVKNRNGNIIFPLLLAIIPTTIILHTMLPGYMTSQTATIYTGRNLSLEFFYQIVQHLAVYETLGTMYFTVISI